MDNKTFRCCYTNKGADGWQTVAVTEGIPSEALEGCIKIQAGNSAIHQVPKNETGGTLDLLELVGDDMYVYLLRSKYGMLDMHGRHNMFSHAYVMSWESGALKNPNQFLSITDESFSDSEEAALNATVVQGSGWTIDEVRSHLSITDTGYLALIDCVAARLTQRGMFDPIYIQYDGSAQSLRMLLYLIYASLPYVLRKKFSAASESGINTKDRAVIFTIEAKTKPAYVDPVTGENNVLNRRVENRLKKLGYVDYPTRNPGSVDANTYFQQLSEKAESFSARGDVDSALLAYAHKTIIGLSLADFDDTDLESLLVDLMGSIAVPSEELERHYADIIIEILRRDMNLADATIEALEHKIEAAKTPELQSAGEQYFVARLLSLPSNQAVTRLLSFDEGTRALYRGYLSKSDEGRDLLDRYYIDLLKSGRVQSWETMEQLAREIAEVPELTVAGKIIGAASSMVVQQFGSTAHLRENCERFKGVVEILTNSQEAQAYLVRVKDVFWSGAANGAWQGIQFADFKYDDAQTYVYMRADSQAKKAEAFIDVCQFIRFYNGEEPRDFDPAEVLGAFAKEYSSILNPSDSEAIVTVLTRELAGIDRFELVREWLPAASQVRTENGIKCIQDIRRALSDKDYEGLDIAFTSLQTSISNQSENPKVATALATPCLRLLKDLDNNETVPLDLWLRIGAEKYPESLWTVIDNYHPATLTYDPDLLKSESYLLGASEELSDVDMELSHRIKEQGMTYIDNKGEYFKKVKSLLAGERTQHTSKSSFRDRIGFGRRTGQNADSSSAPEVEDWRANSAGGETKPMWDGLSVSDYSRGKRDVSFEQVADSSDPLKGNMLQSYPPRVPPKQPASDKRAVDDASKRRRSIFGRR